MRRFAIALLAAVGVVEGAETASAQVVAWHQPAPVFFPAPVQVIGQPVFVAPVPMRRYYRRPIIAYQPTARVVTRHRPILGGSVSRVHRGYRPIIF